MKPKKLISADISEAIGLRAYYIWEREGKPEGRQALHWQMAEAEILSERPVDKAVRVPAKGAKKSATKKAMTKALLPKTSTDKMSKPSLDGTKKSAVAAKSVTAKKKTTKSAPRSGG